MRDAHGVAPPPGLGARGEGVPRKKVIRRVISLQEFLDSFPAQLQTLDSSEIRDSGADAKDNAVLERHDPGSTADG